MEHIYVALIGASRLGQVHGPNVARHRVLHQKFVVDPRPAVASFAATHGAAQTSSEQVLAHPAIGGLLMCSSTDLHLPHALAAIAASTAVLCEKSIDPVLDKLRATQPRFTSRALPAWIQSPLQLTARQAQAAVARRRSETVGDPASGNPQPIGSTARLHFHQRRRPHSKANLSNL